MRVSAICSAGASLGVPVGSEKDKKGLDFFDRAE